MTAVAIIVGVGLLVVVALYASKQRAARRPAAGAAAPAVELDAAAAEQARELVAQGRAIEAIKLVRDRTGLGLREAKEAVDALAAGATASAPALPRPTPGAGAALEAEARALLAEDRKLEAIKLVRDRAGLGLREAKEYVERLER